MMTHPVRRILLLLLPVGVVGALLATIFAPRQAQGEEVPDVLRDPAPPPSAQSRALSLPFVEATRRVRPAVVKIVNFQTDPWRRQLRPRGSGSGFLITGGGHVLTNRHVIADATQLAITLADGREFTDIKLLGADPRSDIAVLKINGAEELPVVTFGDSDRLEVGEWVIAIGAPFNLDSSVSAGVVSAKGRTGVLGESANQSRFSEEFIQTDAALNPGNSGGPLINLDGQVVGINTAIETGQQIRANVGIGFAVPINLARTIAISLLERGVAKRGWLGISVEHRTASQLESMGIRAQGGLAISHVMKGSPAEKAGLKTGEIILSVDGLPIRDARTLVGRLAQAGPDGALRLKATSGAGRETRDLLVALAIEPLFTYGLDVKSLDPAGARERGLPPETQGVVVTRVEEGSIAARADERNRIYPSDIITHVLTYGRQFRITGEQEFIKVMNFLQAIEPPEVVFVLLTKEGIYQVRLSRPENQ